jgi:hydrogenase maturation protease
MDLFTALELGRQLEMPMPEQVDIIAIEVEDVLSFSEACTPQVEAAIPEAAQAVRELLD